MYPSVKDILALSEMQSCYLLHPGVSCSQIVKSVTIMDTPNILEFLSGFEVLLSNGFTLANLQNREWKQFFDGLVQREVAALFIKLEYFIDKLPPEIIEYTAQLDFPVVVVPNKYSWNMLTEPIQQYIIEHQYYLIKEATRLRDTLNRVLVQRGSLDQICNSATASLGIPLAVFDAGHNLLGASEGGKWRQLADLLESGEVRPQKMCAKTEMGFRVDHSVKCPWGQALFLQLSDLNQPKYLALLTTEDTQKLLMEHSFKLDQIEIVIMLHLFKEEELNRVEKYYYNNFMLDMIDGVLREERDIRARAERLVRKMHKTYQLIIWDNCNSVAEGRLVDDLLALFKKERSLIQDIMICEQTERVILFVPIDCSQGRDLVERACAILAAQFDLPEMQFGVSREYTLEETSVAYQEALLALSARRFVKRQIIYYEDLGLLRLFMASSRKADTGFISEFYQNTLQPLVDNDSKNSGQLLLTLEIFFKNNLSVVNTAQALFLHENTLRARIKRIEEITNRSLKVPMDISELMIGLQIHELFYK